LGGTGVSRQGQRDRGKETDRERERDRGSEIERHWGERERDRVREGYRE